MGHVYVFMSGPTSENHWQNQSAAVIHVFCVLTHCSTQNAMKSGTVAMRSYQMLMEGGCFVFSQIDRKGECGVCVRDEALILLIKTVKTYEK